MSVSSMCDYDMARPSWDHHSTSGLGAASPRASTVVSHCLGHHPAPVHTCTFPSTFCLLKGKKPNRRLENCRMLLQSLGALWQWPLWHRAGALPVCFCPDAAETGTGQPPQDAKQQKNISDCVSQLSCTSTSEWGISLLHPDTKHPPVSVGQETPAQCRVRLLTLKMY